MAVKSFMNDDEYDEWLRVNKNSFVVNTDKGVNSSKFFLHTSTCPHITSWEGFIQGIFTEKKHDKFGANDIEELKDFFSEKKYSKFTGEFTICKSCNPDSQR
jgi:hypothetical protein